MPQGRSVLTANNLFFVENRLLACVRAVAPESAWFITASMRQSAIFISKFLKCWRSAHHTPTLAAWTGYSNAPAF